MILVSYPLQARLKIYANAELVNIESNLDLYRKLKPENYQFKPERMMVFHIVAYDWNCPQHITPRYSAEDVETLLEAKNQHIAQLEEKIKTLEKKH